ncbi:MAG TPA: polyphenol oxidase family protein [Solirubrobacterales bacterium]|nr:polyphenol oxidase family protein [Solirubrobacterales bacterium]
MRWQEHDGVKWLVASMDGARIAFSTRRGGVSTGSFEGLNLGYLTEDEPEAVVENRTRLARVLRVDAASIPIARQVHGSRIIHHTGPQEPSPFAVPGSELPEADGHVVTEPGLAPLVFVADCLPVALRGPDGLAMLHCGWRPLAAGIIADAAETVAATEAVIGPGIGRCCYEVGPEVLDSFAPLGEGIADGRMLDLAEVARRLLAEAGVKSVQSADLCTSCNPELFFSHRRDAGRTGRQAGLAWLTPTRFAGEA